MNLKSICHGKFCRNRLFRPRFQNCGFVTPHAVAVKIKTNWRLANKQKIIKNTEQRTKQNKMNNLKHFVHIKFWRIRPPWCRFIQKMVLNGARVCCNWRVNSDLKWFQKQVEINKTGQIEFELYVIVLLSSWQLARAESSVTKRTISALAQFAQGASPMHTSDKTGL